MKAFFGFDRVASVTGGCCTKFWHCNQYF